MCFPSCSGEKGDWETGPLGNMETGPRRGAEGLMGPKGRRGPWGPWGPLQEPLRRSSPWAGRSPYTATTTTRMVIFDTEFVNLYSHFNMFTGKSLLLRAPASTSSASNGHLEPEGDVTLHTKNAEGGSGILHKR